MTHDFYIPPPWEQWDATGGTGGYINVTCDTTSIPPAYNPTPLEARYMPRACTSCHMDLENGKCLHCGAPQYD